MILLLVTSIERDAQLLANRIALLKQEEQKTWKKIDDTKKRTNEILSLKKRNEDRIQKVSGTRQRRLQVDLAVAHMSVTEALHLFF